VKKFKFSLASVAILRAHKEAIAREALAAAVRSCSGVEAHLSEVRLRLSEMESRRSAGRSGRFRAADDVSFFLAYRRECESEAEVQKQLSAALSEVDTRRSACVEANRAVKAIERLKSTCFETYRAHALRTEQAEFDEIAGRRRAIST